jgi:hypothetical protein
MNASDIIKNKQAQTLYKAYYKPTVFKSSIFSTINTVSSIFNYADGGAGDSISTRYTSCVYTVYDYMCQPTFMSYETASQINDGAYVCGKKSVSNLQWKNNNSTVIYAYSSIYSTFATPSISTISTIRIESTNVMLGPSPVITPLITFYQGTSYNSCKCNMANCDGCNCIM